MNKRNEAEITLKNQTKLQESIAKANEEKIAELKKEIKDLFSKMSQNEDRFDKQKDKVNEFRNKVTQLESHLTFAKGIELEKDKEI